MYITFHSGGVAFAMPMADVTEVAPYREIRQLAGTHPWVAGVVIRSGKIVGVADPARIVGAGPGAGDQVLVLRGAPGLGLLAERTDAVTRDYVVEADHPPGSSRGASAETVLRHRGETFRLLELDPLRRRLGAGPEPGGDHDQEDPPR